MSSDKTVNFTGAVTVVGDVMLDSYWKGPSSRISPEAPVPVVRVTDKEERAGGRLWDIVERCISLNADDRYSASELLEALEELRGEIHAEETNG